MLQRLLLLPLLTPLIVVLLVAAINPRPAVALRLLTWTSPALPMGIWLALAAGGGGILSATATSLALRSSPGPIGGFQAGAAGRAPWRRGAADEFNGSAKEVWSDWPQPDAAPSSAASSSQSRGQSSAGPARPPGEPTPTVAVPFRVIRRGQPSPAPASQPSPSVQAGPTVQAGQTVKTAAVGDGWDQDISDDW